MSWRDRDKELTADEAITIAQRDLKDRWFDSPPLLAGYQQNGNTYAVPLEKSFSKGSWLIFGLDPFSFAGDAILEMSKIWRNRFERHGIQFMCILRMPYEFASNIKYIKQFKSHHQIDYPLTIDKDGLLLKSLEVTSLPGAILIENGKKIFGCEKKDWINNLEPEIHQLLRKGDPGLALLPFYEHETRPIFDTYQINFGKGLHPPFTQDDLNSEAAPLEKIKLIGRWNQDGDRIMTKDSSAVIEVKLPSKRFGIVAHTIARGGIEYPKINIRVNKRPTFETFSDLDLVFNDDGDSLIEIKDLRIYRAIKDLQPNLRDLSLYFPNANRCPVGLFGFRFSDD